MPAAKNSYARNEKLKSRKALEQLFSKGKTFLVFPVKVFYTTQNLQSNPTDNSVHAGVGVSTRNFKKAVQRNTIKRLLREVYRTQKHDLHLSAQNNSLQLQAFFLYIGKEMPTHSALQEAMKKTLEKLCEKLEKSIIKN
jgi:ribonuclease P protein component